MKKYEIPEMEVIFFGIESIVTESMLEDTGNEFGEDSGEAGNKFPGM